MLHAHAYLIAAVLGGICLPPAFPQPAAPRLTWEEKRLQRMKFDQMIGALGARDGYLIADVGSGEGVYTVPLSRVVGPRGKVYAVDIDDAALERLRKRIAGASLTNVEVIRGAEDDPKLPAESLDAALLVDTYH